MKVKRPGRVASLLVGALCIVGSIAPGVTHADTAIISLDQNGAPFPIGASYLGPQSVSADGTRIVFETYSLSGTPTIILRDLTTGTNTSIVSGGNIGSMSVISGDGTTIAYQLFTNGGAAYHLYTYNSTTGSTTLIADSNDVFAMALDGSGSHIAYSLYTNNTYSTVLYDATTNTSVTIPGLNEPNFSSDFGLALTPDARFVTTITYDAALNRHLRQYDTTLATTTVAIDGSLISNAESSDGRFTAYRAGSGAGVVVVYDRDTKTSETVGQDYQMQNDVSISADGRFIAYATWNYTGATIHVYDRTTQTTQTIHDASTDDGYLLDSGPFLSVDGRFVYYGHKGTVYRADNPALATGFDPARDGYGFQSLTDTGIDFASKQQIFRNVFGAEADTASVDAWLRSPVSDFYFGSVDGNCFGTALSVGKQYQYHSQYDLSPQQTVYTSVPEPSHDPLWDLAYQFHITPYTKWDGSKVDESNTLDHIVSAQLSQKAWASGVSIGDLSSSSTPTRYLVTITGFDDTHHLVAHTLYPYRIDPLIASGNEYKVWVYDPNYPGPETDRFVHLIKNPDGTWSWDFLLRKSGLLYGEITWGSSYGGTLNVSSVSDYYYDLAKKLSLP